MFWYWTNEDRLVMQVKQMQHGCAIVADLTVEADMRRAIDEATAKMGGLDILVNR